MSLNSWTGGANFDWEGTLPRFTQEAAHSRRRIVHKGDATGRETTDVLIQRVLNTENIHVLQNTFAIDLLTDAETAKERQETAACYGVTAIVDERVVSIRAKATVLATGGLGRLYPCTSNPKVATGDGFAAAWRAGMRNGRYGIRPVSSNNALLRWGSQLFNLRSGSG